VQKFDCPTREVFDPTTATPPTTPSSTRAASPASCAATRARKSAGRRWRARI